MIKLADADRLSRRPGVDLRRRSVRDEAETLVARAAWALPEDRRLIEAVYREGMPARAVAELRGEKAEQVRRRLRRVVRRLLSEAFVFVLRERDGWPAERRRVATASVLQGRSMRDAAKHLKVSFHEVRKQMQVVDALCGVKP